MRSAHASTRSLLPPAVVGFCMALAVRATMVLATDANYAFDGFQRWAGRDHLLIQQWLPLTQSVIVAVAELGGGVTETRLALSLVAAFATAAGCVLAGRIGGRVAAWAFLVPASYGPFLVWGAAMYQEATFLLVLFGALALALSNRLLLADLAMGLLALVRYEGWPCVALYVLWRRDPRALVALWGAAVWVFVRAGLDVPTYAASPVDFDDWEGLRARTTLTSWANDAARLFTVAWMSGAIAYAVAACIALRAAWRRRGMVLLGLIGLGQVAAVSGWLAGLETATHRMLVVPAGIAGVLGAVGAGVLWDRFPRVVRLGLVIYALSMIGVGNWDGWKTLRNEAGRLGPERTLHARIVARPDCEWRVTPRESLGTRSRHDGCEILQGQGFPRHGDGFWCMT
ncbi:MAG: hypothetical protein ACK4YP_09760, partial [Myxococcota bacterium]